MNLENRIEELADDIAARKFKWNYGDKEYEWLTRQCLNLAGLLKQYKAEPVLIKKLTDIARDLEEQNKYLTHDLLRQRTLVFHQDAIIFYLMKEGYIKLLPF
jgi:hypothetical protein